MKVTKKQLKRIIREEKELMFEVTKGGVGLGFSGYTSNRKVDFAKFYGKGARVLRDFGSNSTRQNRLLEADIQGAEERADSVLGELLDGYLDQHLDLSGSNRMDALELAYQDLLNFVDGVIEQAKRDEVNPEYGWAEEDEDDWSRRGPPR